MGVFTLGGPHAGKSMVILEKYPFTDGVFKTPAQFAPLMRRMLVEYYGCTLTYEGDDSAEQVEDDGEGSLAVNSTRGRTEGQRMMDQDLNAKFLAAKKIEDDEALLADQRELEREIADRKQDEALFVAQKELP